MRLLSGNEHTYHNLLIRLRTLAMHHSDPEQTFRPPHICLEITAFSAGELHISNRP